LAEFPSPKRAVVGSSPISPEPITADLQRVGGSCFAGRPVGGAADTCPSGAFFRFFTEGFMPTVKIIGRFRFHFYSADRNEPPHIHVQAGRSRAKFWLDDVSLAYSHGFNDKDLNTLAHLVYENQEPFLEAWNEYFPD
jgi:hypothetical protein